MHAEGTYELRDARNATAAVYLEGSDTASNLNRLRTTFLRVDILDPGDEVIDIYGQDLATGTDVEVWCPGQIPTPTPDANSGFTRPAPDFTGDLDANQGAIDSFADLETVQTFAGHSAPSGIDPLTHDLTGSSASCGTPGTYTVRFASAGIDGAGQEFFDVAVRDDGAEALRGGRVWADKYALSLNGSGNAIESDLFVVAGVDLGERYRADLWRVDLNAIEPYGFQLFANDSGVAPEQYNFVSVNESASPQPELDAQYPIYLNQPAKPIVAPPEVASIGTPTTVCGPGEDPQVIIRFNAGRDGETFAIRVDQNNDGAFGIDETIGNGTTQAGTNIFVWDGELPNGNQIAPDDSYQIQVGVRAGEVHFPFYDVEVAKPGPVITRVEDPNEPPANRYFWNDDGPGVATDPTTSGADGSIDTHNWANDEPGSPGMRGYNDENVIDTWKYSQIEEATTAYTVPDECDTAAAIGLAMQASGLINNGDGSYTTTYGLVVQNFGNTALDDVNVTEDLDSAFDDPIGYRVDNVAASGTLAANAGFDGSINQGLLDPSNSTLPLGASETIDVTVTLTPNGATGTVNNRATASALGLGVSTRDDSVNGETPDPNLDGEPTESSPTPLALPTADLSTTKSGPAALARGGAINWQVVLDNNGTYAADGARFIDRIPAGFSDINARCGAASGGAACASVRVSGQEVTSTVPTLPAGGSVTFTITATAPDTNGGYTNTATVTPPAGMADPISANNTSALLTLVPANSTDLALHESAPQKVEPGEEIVWTLTATNNGPNDADGAVVTHELPAGVTEVSATCGSPTAGAACGDVSVTGTTVTATVPALPVGGSLRYTITATAPDAPGEFANAASIKAPSGITDPLQDNNADSANASITITRGDIARVPANAPWALGLLVAVLSLSGVVALRGRI